MCKEASSCQQGTRQPVTSKSSCIGQMFRVPELLIVPLRKTRQLGLCPGDRQHYVIPLSAYGDEIVI